MSKDTKKQRETLVLVVIGIGANGYRRDLSIMEGHHQDKSGCCGFPKHLKGRGLQGGRLIIFDTYRGAGGVGCRVLSRGAEASLHGSCTP